MEIHSGYGKVILCMSEEEFLKMENRAVKGERIEELTHMAQYLRGEFEPGYDPGEDDER